jgi:hypothetical protein
MEQPLREFMEARFKHDFSGVRLHTDSDAAASARSMGALAYTFGQDIVFDSSSFRPNTPQGLHLIAHELSHVVQQSRSPLPLNEELRVEPETSAAEVEADRTALSVLTPGPVQAKPSARSTGLNRGIGWAFLGGLIGAVVGGLLGALAGPVGAVIGGVAGAALGAWIAGSLSNDQTTDKEGTRQQRIGRLLTRHATDWVITDEEALAALAILRDAEERDPVELFQIARWMKDSGKWVTLLEELPSIMREGLVYFERVPLNPDSGLLMVEDIVHLDFYHPGQPRFSKDQLEEKKKDKNFKVPFEEQISLDYQVHTNGLNIPFIDTPVPVIGKPLKEAADLIAKAFLDPLWALSVAVDLKPVKRGRMYTGFGEVSSPQTVTGGALTKDTEALARHEKRKKFTDLVPNHLLSFEGPSGIAARLYYREIDENLDKHDDPKVLWKWAQEQGEKRYEELNTPSPVEEFLAFGRQMIARIPTLPEKEQARTHAAYSRYIAWLDRHSKDANFAKVDPVDIWVQAYMNVFREELAKSKQEAMAELKEKRYQAEFKKAEVKLGQAIDLATTRIWPTQPTRGFELPEEQLSETTGEPVKIGYLIQASPAEKIIRDKIASDFLHSQIERLMADPEAFNKTTVKADLVEYLNKNPEQLKAFHLTMAYPEVERMEHKVDIPAWQTATEVVVGFIPYVGQAVAIYEVVGGRDLFGHPLTTTERVIIGVAILLPGIAKAFKVGKGALTASKIANQYGLRGAEAARVYKIYTGLGPGTAGAKLFDLGAKEIKAGRTVDDPKVLKEMETVLKDLGMTEKETAKALMPAIQRQAETAAKEEVQALKAVTGAISEETEEMLLKNGPLRQALKDSDLAAKVLKKCNTPCWPENATAAQVQRLEHLLERLKKVNAYDEEALRRFLYERRKDLDKAIDEVSVMASTAEAAQAKATGATATAAGKRAPRVLDVTDQVKAAERLKQAEGKILERRASIKTEREAAEAARKKLAPLASQKQDVPSGLKSEMDRINKLKSLEDRIEALDELGSSKKNLTQAEKDFLHWRRETWALQQEAAESTETAEFLAKRLDDLETARDVAAAELRQASQEVMDVLRSNGPNYRGKSSVNVDQVMSSDTWKALPSPKPPLATDHLVALDRISKLQELNELLILYPQASATVKAEIKAELQALGDMEKNLVRMRHDANSAMKSNKSWEDITYDQARKYQYSPSDVDKMRKSEAEALTVIKDKIAELTARFKAKINVKAAGAGKP